MRRTNRNKSQRTEESLKVIPFYHKMTTNLLKLMLIILYILQESPTHEEETSVIHTSHSETTVSTLNLSPNSVVTMTEVLLKYACLRMVCLISANIIQKQYDELLRQQDQLMKHNELMKQRENDLQKLEDEIRKKTDSLNQQKQHQEQEQQLNEEALTTFLPITITIPPPLREQQEQQQPKRKKAKKERKVAVDGVEFASPILQNTSRITSREEQPTSYEQPHLEALARSQTTDSTVRELNKSTRLKPIISRKLRRQEHWRNRVSMSVFSPASSEKPTNFTPPTSYENQQCLQTISSASSVIGNEFKRAEWQTPSTMVVNNFISKSSVMEFYLKEKLRESGLREFEMFLKSN